MSSKRRGLVVQLMTFHTKSSGLDCCLLPLCNCPISGPQAEPLHGAVRSDEQQDFSLVGAPQSVCLLTATNPIRAGRDGGWGGSSSLEKGQRWRGNGGGAGGAGGGDIDY